MRPHIQRELNESQDAFSKGDVTKAFAHLENAHVLGQESTYLHVVAHVHMFRWALRQRDLKELFGQLFRIVGAGSKTALGLVPSGNTGGANVSPFRSMPLSSEHRELIAQARVK